MILILYSCSNCSLSVVAVLGALGSIAFDQAQYEESLQVCKRLHNILRKVSPDSEDLAAGKERYGGMGSCHCYCYCVVYQKMGACYKKLAQLDAAEEAFSQSLKMKATSKTIHIEVSVVVNNLHALLFCS